MAKATKRQALTALKAIRSAYGYCPGDKDGPRLVEEYHGWYNSYPNAIVWEEGPYEWSVRACGGGFDEELYRDLLEFMPQEQAAERARKKPVQMPKGTYLEAIDGQAVALYKA